MKTRKVKKFTFKKLVQLMTQIKKRGWIKFTRPYNKGGKNDGFLGNTLEDLLGIKENNLKDSDYGKWEIKTKKKGTTSRVSILSATLSYPPSANSIIKEKCGYYEDGAPHKKLYTTVAVGRWTETKNDKKFTYKMKFRYGQLYLLIKNKSKKKVLKDKYYWDIDKIYKNLNRKIKNMCFVSASIDVKHKRVRYDDISLFFGFKFDEFLKLLKDGKIVYEFRIGYDKSGKHVGRAHDHGSEFRVHPQYLDKLFKKHKKI